MIKLIPARESLVSDIPAGDRKIANLFLQCKGLSNSDVDVVLVVQVCNQVERQECYNVPRQVERQECKEIPRQVARQECKNVPRQVPAQKCINIPRQVSQTKPKNIEKIY
jgi:hypothetical protein